MDPRAWAHLLKIVNFYNYTHVQELRAADVDRSANIAPTAGFANGRNLRIGARVTVGAYCQIWAGSGRARIVIGDDTLLGPDVMMTAANYRFNDGSPLARQAMNEADILIGCDCWIGRGTTVLAGARIGDGAVIGANSVVRGTVPPFAIMAGSPARVVGTRSCGAMPENEWEESA
ncbi:acyltransferase [Palleronia abyssalis]|uniref:acyltransferase n=1 Tax=Palleronia abyssalis TaxID=1501240 RepID=UPI001FE3A9A2|nr:acyltransferase [Palleronia abyssalis]